MIKHITIIGAILISVFIAAILLSSSTKDQEQHVKVHASFNPYYAITPVPIPGNLSFAGEEVPLNNFDVYESLDREMLVNTY